MVKIRGRLNSTRSSSVWHQLPLQPPLVFFLVRRTPQFSLFSIISNVSPRITSKRPFAVKRIENNGNASKIGEVPPQWPNFPNQTELPGIIENNIMEISIGDLGSLTICSVFVVGRHIFAVSSTGKVVFHAA